MAASLYKIKLASGRVLGPLDLERVRQLMLKNQVVGTETAREYPQGDWVDINSIAPLADLLVARAEGRLEQSLPGAEGYTSFTNEGGLGSTQVLPGAKANLPGAEGSVSLGLGNLQELKEINTLAATQALPPTAHGAERDGADLPEMEVGESGDGDKTAVYTPDDLEEKTRIASDASGILELDRSSVQDRAAAEPPAEIEFMVPDSNLSRIANEKTVVFQRSGEGTSVFSRGGSGSGGQASAPKRQNKIIEALKIGAVAIAIGILGYQVFLDEGETTKPVETFVPIRPRLPEYDKARAKPEESIKVYGEGMRYYVQDTVTGYKLAVEKLLVACSLDITNVKALAMLASSYLNLIDSSNKDENYFHVIYQLIKMSRAKEVDLPETVIADVEFYIMANKAPAAESRIVEYTKKNPSFGPEMFYYLGLTFFHRGDFASSARYLGTIPDEKAFSAKVFYLRGLVAEKLGDMESGIKQYEKALAKNPAHAKTRLKISEVLNKQGSLKEAAAHLDYLVNHASLLAPKDLARTYFLHSQLSIAYGKPAIALGDMERAVKLDRDNHDYLLELYTLRAQAGDTSVKGVQAEARMYFFLSEGEKVLRLGKYHDALIQFLQAHEANLTSPLPLVKAGDMFRLQNDVGNATINYRKAAERAPNNIEVWSKYINMLIQSYEWEEAKKAMDKFRNLPVPQSAVDKATADWFAKQNQHVQAQIYYKKAMARDTVDPDVYIAYAKSLMATRHFAEAPFFFALALRFDPLNMEAILGTAKCVASTDSIERAITMLQDELSKGNHPSAEILTAIAELYIQKGEWELAQQMIDQARNVDHDLALPWKLQAQIFMNREGSDKNAIDKAAAAYQSYSERNPSDPSGYIERYYLFLRKSDFEKAGEELAKVFGLFPKYPRLHFLKGWLYGMQGNHRAAAEEYRKELANNPGGVQTLIALGKELIELGQVAGAGGAQELFTKAMQIQPTNPEAKQQAGYAAYLLKNYQAAIALYNGALAYDKANPLIYKRMGMAYRDMGDPTGAATAFRKYLEMEPDAPDKAEFERYR